MKPLPDFGKHEAVIVLGNGPSLSEYSEEKHFGAPTVGCNSIVEKWPVTIWCSAHTNLAADSSLVAKWINTKKYEYAFFMRRFIALNRSTDVSVIGYAQERLRTEVFAKIFWIDRADISDVFFRKQFPFCYFLPICHEAGFSSGILSADIALRLGAKKIVLYGYDYIPFGGMSDPDDCDRLHLLHKTYFENYPIPVEYRGANQELREFHKRNT